MFVELPQRKRIRLKNYDYSQNGAYFVTICTLNRKYILGEIVGQVAPCLPQIKLTEIGHLADKYINNIAKVYEYVTVDKYIIMPDHIHMIIVVDRPTLNKIVRSVKAMTTKRAGFPIFQASFFEHIIRNENDLYETRKYVENNPLRWELKNGVNK